MDESLIFGPACSRGLAPNPMRHEIRLIMSEMRRNDRELRLMERRYNTKIMKRKRYKYTLRELSKILAETPTYVNWKGDEVWG